MEDAAQCPMSPSTCSAPPFSDKHVQALDKMIVSSAASQAMQTVLTEGISFILLRSIGKILFLSNFRGNQETLERGGIQPSMGNADSGLGHASRSGPPPSPQRLVSAACASEPAPEHLSSEAQVIVPKLLHLLERCRSVMGTGLGDHSDTKIGLDSSLGAKLQDTLLHHLFGPQPGHRDDIFTLPQPVQTPLPTATGTDVYRPDLKTIDGFVEGLWSIVGWDVLASKCAAY